MSPESRQQALEHQLLQFEDVQERLAFVQDRVRRRPAFGIELRTDANRLRGCLTPVWLVCREEAGRCYFEVDSESAMVRGLASLLVEVLSGATPGEIASFECAILQGAGLVKQITPTRLQGLAHLEAAMRAFATKHA